MSQRRNIMVSICNFKVVLELWCLFPHSTCIDWEGSGPESSQPHNQSTLLVDSTSQNWLVGPGTFLQSDLQVFARLKDDVSLVHEPFLFLSMASSLPSSLKHSALWSPNLQTRLKSAPECSFLPPHRLNKKVLNSNLLNAVELARNEIILWVNLISAWPEEMKCRGGRQIIPVKCASVLWSRCGLPLWNAFPPVHHLAARLCRPVMANEKPFPLFPETQVDIVGSKWKQTGLVLSCNYVIKQQWEQTSILQKFWLHF